MHITDFRTALAQIDEANARISRATSSARNGVTPSEQAVMEAAGLIAHAIVTLASTLLLAAPVDQ